MHTFVSQDLVTIRGSANASITQGHNGWLDLTDFQDVVAWLDVREQTSGTNVFLYYETAPTADDSLFVPLSGPLTTMPLTPSVGITVTPILKELQTVPLARWFRWLLVANPMAGTWDITFRLFLSTNCLRGRPRTPHHGLEHKSHHHRERQQ